MKFDIIGAGSLGLLLAGMLAGTGAEVRVWCRSRQQCVELARSGITVSYEDGSAAVSVPGSSFKAETVEHYAQAQLADPGDWTLLTVKQKVVHGEFKALLSPLKHCRLNMVCFQNGWGHLDLLQELLPASAVWAAVTTEAAKRKTLTEVIHAGRGELCIGRSSQFTADGGLDGQNSFNENAFSFVQALAAAGFNASLSKEVDTIIYRKLLINAVINPLTAIWRVPNGELLASSERVQIMKALYTEAVQVYDASDISYDPHTWEAILEVCRATAGNISSMLADVLASRETEISWINGSIVNMGLRRGLEVPLHRWICGLVDGMTVRER
ncbi:2-dehydropantoate 2-reductase [Paenibacillus sp. MMS20-IR301]|uniref:ketopantoate reductase family protein n=1 Tax=Paenibacillus sp. MMS20-IR301 TaxID=2895946 RepID=UPI0028E9A9FE|nr:2-dehydropantoate 2-reductase [Paenibacillus sp. MMS20-IR301]WNS43812.1 2-dehydropantoate 2-reductase [Paenibacillus sp. MMS20-IR301]